jgi:P-type Ca2+ transporter type 2C
MTAAAGPAAGSAKAAPDLKWYALSPAEATNRHKVDPATGLTAAEAKQRIQT